MSDRDEGVLVEIVGGPKDGTEGIGLPGVTDKIMWRDGNSGKVLIHRFSGMTADGKALYLFEGYAEDPPPSAGTQN